MAYFLLSRVQVVLLPQDAQRIDETLKLSVGSISGTLIWELQESCVSDCNWCQVKRLQITTAYDERAKYNAELRATHGKFLAQHNMSAGLRVEKPSCMSLAMHLPLIEVTVTPATSRFLAA
jgi:hypothetical protein